jgi:CRP-like cAMP-binding protein
MAKTNLDYLRALPPFKELSGERLNRLSQDLSVVGYPRGKIVFEAGDEGDAFYIIKSGIVRVFIQAPDSGEKVVLSNLSEGDYFGEMALLTGGPRSASIETVSNVSLIRLERKAFEDLLEDPKVSISISNMLSQRLMQANLQRAASEQFYKSKISPSGILEDHSVIEIMKFCEENSLTGRVVFVEDEKQGIISFARGTVQKVALDDLGEAEALDHLTQWKSGRFKIEPSMFTLDDENKKQEKVPGKIQEKSDIGQKKEGENCTPVLQTFLHLSFKKFIDLVGSQQLKEMIAQSQEKCLPFFPVLKNCRFEIIPEIKIVFKNEGEWTEKDTLGIAVFLEILFKNCQENVFGMSFLDPQELAGESAESLKAISFFEYMNHAREFTF